MITHWLSSIDSTNSEALRQLSRLPSGSVLAAYDQTAGRGQRGNSWFTEPGKNLTFSIVLKNLPLKASEGIRLNYLSSVALVEFLDAKGVKADIKWPNDIYLAGKKISGMLIENSLGPEGGIAASVIGIGLNMNQKEFSRLALATSLALCTGREYALEASLEEFLAIFEGLLPQLSAGELTARYNSRLYRLGVSARYHDLLTDEEFEGVIEGVEADGRLRIRDLQGRTRLYRFKEVAYLL